jgi:deoxyribonuclease V
MKVRELHGRQLSTGEAIALQLQLAPQISADIFTHDVRFIAGVDVRSPVFSHGEGTAAVAVLTYPELEIIEVSVEHGEIQFPYVPGLLSFRELPLVIRAFEKLSVVPDLVLVDGQGIAHPRRFGIAAHLGLLLDKPTIGCAKSRLIGEYEEPGKEAGSSTCLKDNNETIGAVVRTKTSTKPVYVSVGHKVSLEQSVYWVRACCHGYRLPEPTRQAHLCTNKQPETVPA